MKSVYSMCSAEATYTLVIRRRTGATVRVFGIRVLRTLSFSVSVFIFLYTFIGCILCKRRLASKSLLRRNAYTLSIYRCVHTTRFPLTDSALLAHRESCGGIDGAAAVYLTTTIIIMIIIVVANEY